MGQAQVLVSVIMLNASSAPLLSVTCWWNENVTHSWVFPCVKLYIFMPYTCACVCVCVCVCGQSEVGELHFSLRNHHLSS